VLITVAVGMPESSRTTVSRTVHGAEDPQWPTPFITQS
jgi:hypothetical protein